MQKLINN